MIPLILIALGVVVVATAGRGERGTARIGSPRVAATVPAQPPMPNPLLVLNEFARRGAPPPPMVITCAIAEAEACNRPDIVQAIMRAFVQPVVQQAPRQRATLPPPLPPLASAPTALMLPHASADDRVFEAPVSSSRDRSDAMMPAMSPINGVDPTSWQQFCSKVAREEPVYQSSRHVGQFRQRKERLAELGIDPATVIGDPAAQRQALDTDLADAHHHLTTSGLAEQHIGRLIRVPGEDDAVRITLSGVLGVIQAAGLEGAVGWLESQNDRKRFPHTTAAFARTNGMF